MRRAAVLLVMVVACVRAVDEGPPMDCSELATVYTAANGMRCGCLDATLELEECTAGEWARGFYCCPEEVSDAAVSP